MQTNQLIQRSGVALVINGLLFAAAQFVHPPDADSNALLHPLWASIHLLVALAFAVGAYGLVGLHRSQEDKSGRLGRIAFRIAFFAAIISAIASLVEVILPAIVAADSAPKSMTAMLDPAGPVPWALPIFLLTLVGFLFGYVLLGIAIFMGMMPMIMDRAQAGDTRFTAHMRLNGLGGGDWTIRVVKGLCRVSEEVPAQADLTMHYQSPEVFVQMMRKMSNPLWLMLTSKIKVQGFGAMGTFGKLFAEPQPDRVLQPLMA